MYNIFSREVNRFLANSIYNVFKREDLTIRTCLKRLNLRMIGHSKLTEIHQKVIGTFIVT
ncbi:IS1 family transposase [Candidatus Enterovibrio escicola]|uniref:IS1 family transposase n=1 Tax=Candidatus Enterovibrio escicola TaxID=1927127 RepID=UPI000BE418F5